MFMSPGLVEDDTCRYWYFPEYIYPTSSFARPTDPSRVNVAMSSTKRGDLERLFPGRVHALDASVCIVLTGYVQPANPVIRNIVRSCGVRY